MFVAIERRSMATAIFSFDGRRAKQRWWPRVGFNTLPNLDSRGFSALHCTECAELSLIQCPLVQLTHCDNVTYSSRPSPHTRHRSELPTKRACHALIRIAASWAAFPNKSHLSILHAVHDCPLLSQIRQPFLLLERCLPSVARSLARLQVEDLTGHLA